MKLSLGQVFFFRFITNTQVYFHFTVKKHYQTKNHLTYAVLLSFYIYVHIIQLWLQLNYGFM